MFKAPVTKEGDGIRHYSMDVPPEKLAGLARVVCDGAYWYGYHAGDEIPEAHSHEAMTRRNESKKPVKGAKNPPL